MKKLGKVFATLAAVAMLGVSFFSCSNDSDGGGGGSKSSIVDIGDYTAPAITGSFYPAADSTDAFVDTDLYVVYGSNIEIDRDSTAKITISDGSTTDEISVKDESYAVDGCSKTTASVKVNKELVMAAGNVLVIKPHSILTAGKTYTVTVPAGVVKNQDAKTWSFTPAAMNTPAENVITVGTDCASINGALKIVGSAAGDWTINVPAGSYHEILGYYGNANVTIVGAEADKGSKSKVFWNNSQALGNSQRTRQSFIWEGGNLTIKNMTFRNTANRAEEGNVNIQAETLYFDCKADLVVYNSSFSSYQDTLLIGNNGGRAWFYKCQIEGDVDFIWGYADVALFENCEIVCLADGIKNDAKIFASRTVYSTSKTAKGFVLLNSNVTIQDGCKAAYGRSSGADTQASVINCSFTTKGSGTLAAGLWGNPSDTRSYEPNGEMAVGYKDYGNKLNGKAVDESGRIANTASMSKRLVNREYNGRWTILNRYYSADDGAYKTNSSIWDISAYENEFGAPKEASKENIYVEPVYTKDVVGGNTVQLTASTTSSDTLTYTYSSDKTSIATVDANGLVTAATGVDGSATITVTASNGSKDYATVAVIGTRVDVESIAIEADSSVDAYALNTVTASFTPANATVQLVTWTVTGDLKIVDPSTKTLVTTLESTGAEIQVEGLVPGGSGTITAVAVDNASATASKNITITSVRDYNAVEGTNVNSKDETAGCGILNFQGTVGMWHDLYVEGKLDSSKGKICASGERVQSRLGTIYIPVTANCYIDMTCQKYNDTNVFASDFADLAGNAPTTYEDENAETYKYHYKWELDVTNDTAKLKSGSDVLALYNAATKDTNRSWTNHTPDSNAKYFGIVIPANDRYWTHITITEDANIHHEAASAELSAGDFSDESVTLDLDTDTTVTKTITASSSDNASPVITYSSDATSIASVDSSTGAVTLKGLVGTANITATVSHPTDSNVAKITKSYKVIVKQTTATESMYFDFRGTGIAGEFDYGVLSGSATYHGSSYGINSANLKLKVLGPSRIYFAQMDYGSDHTVKNGEDTIGVASTLGSGKCTKTSLEEAITEGYVSYVTYTGSDATTLSITGSQYLSRFWVAKYEAAAVEITASDFASANATLDLNGSTTITNTITASATGDVATTIAYSSSKTGVATVDASTGAVTAVAIGRSLITATVSAEGAEAVTKTYIVTVKDTATPSGTYTLDFASGNIFDATTKANSIDLGIASLNAGSKNAYGYNGTQHGIFFKQDNRVTLSVKAGSVITITNCAYDAAYTLLVSTDGTTAVSGVTVSGTNGATVSEGVVSIPAGDGSTDGKTTIITIPNDFTGSSVTLVHTGDKTDYLHEISVAY